MGLLGKLFGGSSKNNSWDEENLWDGSDPMICPNCGQPMTKKYTYSEFWCDNCDIGEYHPNGWEEDDDESESISVWDAADIWASKGYDEDYMFGYTQEELENALNR